MPARDHERDAILVRLAVRCMHAKAPFPRFKVVADGLGISRFQARALVIRLEGEGKLKFARYGGRLWVLPVVPVIHSMQTVGPTHDVV